jgi:hypothetical protein
MNVGKVSEIVAVMLAPTAAGCVPSSGVEAARLAARPDA